MKTALRSACVAVLTLLLVSTASPAVAKGPTDVKVSGPGVDTRLGYRTSGGEVDLGTLSDAARVIDILGSPRLFPSPGVSDLGARYVLTWTAGGAGLVVQHAYPFARGGAWVRVLPTESGWGTGESGWLRAPGLTDQLVALGAGEETSPSPVVATTEGTPARDDPRASDPAGRSPYAVGVPVGIVLLVVLGAGALLARRRLLSR